MKLYIHRINLSQKLTLQTSIKNIIFPQIWLSDTVLWSRFKQKLADAQIQTRSWQLVEVDVHGSNGMNPQQVFQESPLGASTGPCVRKQDHLRQGWLFLCIGFLRAKKLWDGCF